MKHLVYILFTTFFLLFSCAKQTPKGILSEEEAVDLFTEVSLVDAYLNTLPLDSGRKVLPVLYDNLFKQFGIDSNRFKQNVDFYYGNPLLTETVYTKVGEKLMEYEKGYRYEDSVRNVFVQDSIQYISNLQRLHRERLDILTNYTKDTTSFTYKSNGVDFFDRNNLRLNAYGIQAPAIIEEVKPLNESTTSSDLPSIELEEESVLDTAVESTIQKKEVLRIKKDSMIQKRRESTLLQNKIKATTQ